jgi:hypothetical protein
VLGGLLCCYSGFSITGEFLAIPKDGDLQLSDLNEPIFSGAENVIKNIKIVSQYDSVNLALLIFVFYFINNSGKSYIDMCLHWTIQFDNIFICGHDLLLSAD